ncbi:MAG: hypothetical protein M3010_08560 [Candidatus Dormibacteraeota bacterium]|nr:hypothetical protein [Candidatus Dormibacteraeota bacterium]
MEERVRRSQLNRLDSILDALERLNLADTTRLPSDLRQDLELAGVHVPARPNITDLIERVWELQEEYLDREEGGEHQGVASRRPAAN